MKLILYTPEPRCWAHPRTLLNSNYSTSIRGRVESYENPNYTSRALLCSTRTVSSNTAAAINQRVVHRVRVPNYLSSTAVFSIPSRRMFLPPTLTLRMCGNLLECGGGVRSWFCYGGRCRLRGVLKSANYTPIDHKE